MKKNRSIQKTVFLKLPAHRTASDFIPLLLKSGKNQTDQIRTAVDTMELTYPYTLQYKQSMLSSSAGPEQPVQFEDGDIITVIPVLIGG